MIRCLDCKKALTKGIISKAVKGEIESTFHNRNYYYALLDSVEFPRVRLFLDISSTEIHNTVGPDVRALHINASPALISKYSQNAIYADLFSPPFPLCKDDSMGFVREGTFSQTLRSKNIWKCNCRVASYSNRETKRFEKSGK